MALGREAGLTDGELEHLEIGSFLHDIGKIGGARRRAHEARRARRERVDAHADPSARRCADCVAARHAAAHRAVHPQPPRALVGRRLSRQPVRRGHPAHRAHRLPRRCLRRHGHRPPVQGGHPHRRVQEDPPSSGHRAVRPPPWSSSSSPAASWKPSDRAQAPTLQPQPQTREFRRLDPTAFQLEPGIGWVEPPTFTEAWTGLTPMGPVP